MDNTLPLGKLPLDLLARLLHEAPVSDPRVLLGPGVGLDCAVLEVGSTLLVLKSDPITFATDEIGWYAVQVNANDIVTTGAEPRWFLSTLLLPEGSTTPELAERITYQVYRACAEKRISVVGGHTEVTAGLPRPIILGTMVGETTHAGLITPQGARPGDLVLLTKGVPVEATALLAREFPDRLRPALTGDEIRAAQEFLYDPGISITRDAAVATAAGRVTAMHDPTEGGLAGALWELAAASGCGLRVDLKRVPVPPLAARICDIFEINPFASISSGALLLTATPEDALAIREALERDGIPCAEIGQVESGPPQVLESTGDLLPRPARDEIARVFEG